MGSGLVITAPSQQEEKSLRELFIEAFPYYLHIGMTADEYWRGSPELAVFYREKYRLDKKERNQEMWLQGFYFYKALATALNNAFSKRKDKYFEEPLTVVQESEAEKAERARREAQKVVEYLNRFKTGFEKKNKT